MALKDRWKKQKQPRMGEPRQSGTEDEVRF
jgi:hypothetical protein